MVVDTDARLETYTCTHRQPGRGGTGGLVVDRLVPTGELWAEGKIFSRPHLPGAELEAVADDGHERRDAEPRNECLDQ